MTARNHFLAGLYMDYAVISSDVCAVYELRGKHCKCCMLENSEFLQNVHVPYPDLCEL